ncbi:hypothetical protein CBR_g9080 [Chara braunii]|uniref:RNA-directed DNA polymerase n=1 Tax=Chara braunii TaxID=69332 RepID=A0A388KNQ5_CHABU|nr:hypothetical protein CBR_g9080 [Chara braunii]|eukprot:GBG71665.1 hypothetical protein CBR_g9080 [Chara braunii]
MFSHSCGLRLGGTKAYLRGFTCAEQTKVATVLGLLEGPALKWATSTSSSLEQRLEDWAFGLGVDRLLQALEDRFADKERARKATDRIARLGQQRYSGTLQSLFAEFEQLTSTPGLVMSTDDLLTNFCRAASEKFAVALYSVGHKDWRSFGRATLDMEAKLHVQAPSSDKRKGAFPPGGRKGKAAFTHVGSGSASDSDSQVMDQYGDLMQEPFGLPNRPTKHHIELLPGAVPPKGIYRMSATELEELRKQLETLTSKGWIRPSTSEFGAPVLFVPKGNGEFRMCIDYRGLNKITRKSTEPIPRIDDLLDMVKGCTVFNKIDLKSGYHQIEMAKEDVHKTAFKTRYGTYEYVAMPFGLCNAPGTFQTEMHRIFRPYLDKFMVVYLNDILVFSRTVREHAEHLALVLQSLRDSQYKINREKTSFGVPSIIYLGHVISGDDLTPEAAKIAVVQEWPQPQTVRDVRSFMGLASYYKKFVMNLFAVAAPLTNLIKKDTPFLWSLPCQLAFTRLKKALTRAPVLKLPDPTLPFILTTDASQYGIGAVLQQDDGNGLLPVEFMSKKIKTQKLQDSTYEKELYALVCALKHWKHFFLGRHFKIFSNHSTLQWMKSQGELNDKLARYIQFIDMLDFELKHKKGCYNKVADALSRRPDSFALISSTQSFGEETRQTIARLLPQDPTYGPMVKTLQADPNSEPGYALSSDLLYAYSRVGTRGGTSTTPYTNEEEEKMAAILQERKEKKEAKKKALQEEQATKLKKVEEEMAREKESLKKEEEEKLKEVEEEEKDEPPLQRRRGQHSGSKDEEMEKRISEWVANLSLGEDEEVTMYIPKDEQEDAMKKWEAEEDVLKQQAMQDETRMVWKLAMMREKKRRVEAASEAVKDLEEVQKLTLRLTPQVDLQQKVEIIAQSVERLARLQEQQYEFSRSQDIAVRSMRMGFRDFARELVGAVGAEVNHCLEKTELETPTPHVLMAEVAGRCLDSCPETACVRVSLDTSLTGVAEELKERMPAWAKIKKEQKGQLILVDVEIFRGRVGALVDSRATRSYISRKALQKLKLGLKVQKLADPIVSILADNRTMIVEDYVEGVQAYFRLEKDGKVEKVLHSLTLLIEDSLPFDIVLGMDWGEAVGATLHLKEHKCKLPSPSGEAKAARLFHVSGVENPLAHCCLSAPAFARFVKKEHLEEQVFVAYVRPVTEPKEEKPIDPAIAQLLEEFKDLAESPTGVVPRPIQHRIEIEPGSRTPKGAVYRMSPRELEELRKQLDELLEKGWIRPSSSAFGAPVLFVPKKEGELRMCIDYRGLNAVTVKNVEPLPRIDNLLDRVQGAKYFSKIDLKSEYHQIEVHPDDQYKTTFRTRYGYYEFIMMPFGLTNAPTTFQRCMNDLFRPWLDRFVVVYLDDILVFSKTLQEHQGHLRQVLEKLREANFKINAKKCDWAKTQVLYLGHVLDGDGVKPEDCKIAAIRDWPTPRTLTELRLLRKETIWKWDKDCTSAMKKLKQALIEYPVLKVADPSLPFVVTTDASQYGIGAVLQQDDGNGYRPVEFISARMPSEKVATSTYERELYALRQALEHWKHYLLGRHFKVYSDHETLRWLKTQAKMTPKLTRWAAEIDQYDFDLKPVKGKYNTYPVFHASKLLPFIPADAFPDRPPQFGPPIPGKGYDVESIEDEWGTGLDWQYLVKFCFQPHTEDRWFARKELLKTSSLERKPSLPISSSAPLARRSSLPGRVLDEVLKVKMPVSLPLDLSHIAVLFVIDSSRDGRFSLDDIFQFIDVMLNQERLCKPHDFLSHLQGWCTLRLWKQLTREEGPDKVEKWFLNLVSENLGVHHTDDYPGVHFIYRDTIQTVHEVQERKGGCGEKLGRGRQCGGQGTLRPAPGLGA